MILVSQQHPQQETGGTGGTGTRAVLTRMSVIRSCRMSASRIAHQCSAPTPYSGADDDADRNALNSLNTTGDI